jgi:hypothetical protein
MSLGKFLIKHSGELDIVASILGRLIVSSGMPKAELDAMVDGVKSLTKSAVAIKEAGEKMRDNEYHGPSVIDVAKSIGPAVSKISDKIRGR